MGSNQTRTFWLSIGLAIFAMFLIYSYSQEKKAEYDKRYGANKQVVVAKKDILEMSTIDDTMLDTIQVPKEFIQPGAIESPEDAVEYVAAAPFKQGEQVLVTKLLKPGPSTGLSMQVAPGKRAITVPVDDVRGVGKLIRPGDRVDIITAVESSKGLNAKVEIKTLLQDVAVLATGANITNNIPRQLEISGGNKAQFKNLNGDMSFSNITVEVTPKQAQDIIYVLSTAPASMFMTLRNPNDRTDQTLAPSSVGSVMGRLDTGFTDAREPAGISPPIVVPPVPLALPKKVQKQTPKRGNFKEY